MYEALRIVVEAFSDSIAVEEAAADALFTAGIEIAARGAIPEAEAIRSLSRMHRIKALGLRGQLATLHTTATRHYQTELCAVSRWVGSGASRGRQPTLALRS